METLSQELMKQTKKETIDSTAVPSGVNKENEGQTKPDTWHIISDVLAEL